VRSVAALKRPAPRAPVVRAAALAVALGLAIPGAVAAEDPTQPPIADPPRATCAERFPAEGPAGVDLRLGCIVGELVGLYTASSEVAPTPASTYAIALAAAIGAALLVAWLAALAIRRRAGRRLAPVLPGTWWVCDRCHSVNPGEARRCYACGAPPSDGPALPTGERPETPQSFGDPGSRAGR
jgi:hypothetical protein